MGTRTLTDTNDNGKYINASSTIVGETVSLVASKPRQTVRKRENGSLTPQQAFVWNYYSNLYNATTLVFDQFSIQIGCTMDSAISSSLVDTTLNDLNTCLTAGIITSIRNGVR